MDDSGYCMDELAERPPHVLTLEELYGHDGAFLVEYNPRFVRRRPMWAFLYLLDENKAHLQFAAGFEKYSRKQYGVTWRCWSGRPSDIIMEAVKWNDRP